MEPDDLTQSVYDLHAKVDFLAREIAKLTEVLDKYGPLLDKVAAKIGKRGRARGGPLPAPLPSFPSVMPHGHP